MDGLSLLHQARVAGLRVQAAGNALKITGPRRAEHLVKLLAEHKSAVLAALAPDARSGWQERYEALIVLWSSRQRSSEEAHRLAWADLQNEWHVLHGRRWPAWQCAGCNRPLSGHPALDLPCGNRVHLEDLECLIAFGRRWRHDAHQALITLGMHPSEGEMLS
jgi:hypothetical protein